MSDKKFYAEPVGIDEVIVGATVCEVETSRHFRFKEGDWVVAYSGWQDYMLSDGIGLMPLGEDPHRYRTDKNPGFFSQTPVGGLALAGHGCGYPIIMFFDFDCVFNHPNEPGGLFKIQWPGGQKIH